MPKKNEKPDAKKWKNQKPQRTTKPKNRSFSVKKPKNQPKKSPNPKNRKSKRPPPLMREQPLTGLITARAVLKKVFHCFYKITFLRKNAQLFVMAMIKREILTSRKVLYTKSCTRNQFLFCKKMLSKIRIFLTPYIQCYFSPN